MILFYPAQRQRKTLIKSQSQTGVQEDHRRIELLQLRLEQRNACNKEAFFSPRIYLEVMSSTSAAAGAFVMTTLISFGGSC